MRVSLCLAVACTVSVCSHAQTPAPPSLASLRNPGLAVDIAAKVGQDQQARSMQAGCANQPFSHDARIWSVIVSARFDQVGGLEKDPNFPFYKDSNGALYVIMFEGPSDEITIDNKGKPMRVLPRHVAGQLWFEIPGLTLAELGDVADAVQKNASVFGGHLTAKGYRLKLYRLTGQQKGKPADPFIIYRAFIGTLDPTVAGAEEQLSRRVAGLVAAEVDEPTPFGSVHLKTEFLDSQPVGSTLTFDAASLAALKKNIGSVVRTGKSPVEKAVAAPGVAAAVSSLLAGGKKDPEVFVVDEPCISFSVAPVLSGENSSLAGTFRIRYDFYRPEGTMFTKIRADGDFDARGNYFNRGEAKVDLGANNKGAVWVSGGLTTGYAFTRVGGRNLDEWTTAGKFQLHLPQLLFRSRPGSQSRPILSFEGGAAGGNKLAAGAPVLGDPTRPATENTTKFVTKGTFTYSVRPSSRLTVDVWASGGAAASEFFGGRRYFSNVRAQARINLTKDYDFVARYDCGRRNPDYRKFCGWQTGFVLVTGR